MFVQWPTQRFARLVESQAHRLRSRLRIDHLATLEPSALVATYESMVLADLRTLADVDTPEMRVLHRESSSWSAIAFRMNGGPWLITWNPWHAPTRTRVSVMEEVCHIVLEHKPTALLSDPLTGLPRRTFSPSKEKHAYAVAAAALVPYTGLVHCLHTGMSTLQIANAYGVSEALVTMRVNVTRAREARLQP